MDEQFQTNNYCKYPDLYKDVYPNLYENVQENTNVRRIYPDLEIVSLDSEGQNQENSGENVGTSDSQKKVIILKGYQYDSANIGNDHPQNEVTIKNGYSTNNNENISEATPLNSIIIQDSMNFKMCPICLDEIEKNLFKTVCCSQYFHKKCYQDWVYNKKKFFCPICRHQHKNQDIGDTNARKLSKDCGSCVRYMCCAVCSVYLMYWLLLLTNEK